MSRDSRRADPRKDSAATPRLSSQQRMRQLIRSVREAGPPADTPPADTPPADSGQHAAPPEATSAATAGADREPQPQSTAAFPEAVQPAVSPARPVLENPPPATAAARPAPRPPAASRVAVPRSRDALNPELEAEIRQALGEESMEQLLESDRSLDEAEIALHGRVKGAVVAVRGDDVFVDLGGRNQGVLPLSQFDSPPDVGTTLEATVHAERPEDGLFELALAGAVVDVADWSQVAEGLIVEGVVTGHNQGGLEVRVGTLRGFMPASQIALLRTDDLSQFVEQKFSCLVVEADPRRRKLVLSRRAVLERELAESKQKLWDTLAVGQIHEGVVRSLQDFGAFVDLGGVDGLIHISQLSWDRVGHPSEVLTLGQKVRVRIEKVDPVSRRIGLSYRDLFKSPWVGAAAKYPVHSRVAGTVAKLMDIGALVRLEPGVSGLVHISEISHKRVHRVKDVLNEGDAVDAVVLSVDEAAQRISLSIKALEAKMEAAQAEEDDQEGESASTPSRSPADRSRRDAGLRGGLDRPSGGRQFGLNW